MHTKESVAASLKSYSDAMDLVFSRFSCLDRAISGMSSELVDDWCYRSSAPKQAGYATQISSHIGELFEFGRPKMVEKSWFLWTSDFFRVSLRMDVPYQKFIYRQAERTVDAEGNTTKERPAHLKPENHRITVVFLEKNVGLGGWRDAEKKLTEHYAALPAPLMQELKKAIRKADEQVQRWKDAICNRPAILSEV